MANVRHEHTLEPSVSLSNQFVPLHEQQGRFFTTNHSMQPCMQVPEQLQHELPKPTPEQAHDRIEPLSEPLPDANQGTKVTIPSIDPYLITFNGQDLTGIITGDQVQSRTLPNVRFTPEQERELLSILADMRRHYSEDQSTKVKHHEFRGRPQDAIGVIAGRTIRAAETFVTSPEPSSMATGTKRKCTRRASATGAGASSSFHEVPAQVPNNTQALSVQELANLTTLADTTTTTAAETSAVNLGEEVNDVDERVSKEAVEKWLEDCRLKE